MTDEPLRIRPDGRGVWIYPLTFGRAKIAIGQGPGQPGYGKWIDEHW